MDKKRILLISTAILAGTLLLVGHQITSTQITNQQGSINTIAVEGEGKANATPDTLTINVNVSELGKTTEEAQTLADQKVEKIKNVLSGFDIPKRNLKTTNVNTYEESERNNNQKKVLGRRSQQSLAIKVDGTGFYQKGADILKQISKIGGINVNGSDFSLENKEDIIKQAREKAVTNAKSKAEQLANVSDLKLGKAIIITEQSIQDYDTPIMYAKAEVAGSSDGSITNTPLSPGKTEITVRLNITYETK